MAIQGINLFSSQNLMINTTQMPLSFENKADEGKEDGSFIEALNGIIEQVSDASKQKEQLTSDLVRGKDVDIHSILVSQTKVEVLTSLASTVMTKATTAYQTLMNLQI